MEPPFGPAYGKVFLEVLPDQIIEINPIQWTETYILARLDIFTSILRPYYGRIWIQTGNELTSNTWPMQFIPIYSLYKGSWSKSTGMFNPIFFEIALENQILPDNDFTITNVELVHSGDGSAHLLAPFAEWNLLAQGFLGYQGIYGSSTITINWTIRGPRGIVAPDVPDIGYWALLGDEY